VGDGPVSMPRSAYKGSKVRLHAAQTRHVLAKMGRVAILRTTIADARQSRAAERRSIRIAGRRIATLRDGRRARGAFVRDQSDDFIALRAHKDFPRVMPGSLKDET